MVEQGKKRTGTFSRCLGILYPPDDLSKLPEDKSEFGEASAGLLGRDILDATDDGREYVVRCIRWLDEEVTEQGEDHIWHCHTEVVVTLAEPGLAQIGEWVYGSRLCPAPQNDTVATVTMLSKDWDEWKEVELTFDRKELDTPSGKLLYWERVS